ncbi:hypothetical protein HSRCO_3031 (plasmid) [Halanaeroarchaeum sp. HSR-CO]|uniref:hypothetical protein n=1 Tax=Halanaeroarchaeum sp. HSR-CO TaxID=2866382 RepID=UPI00217D1D82|nr:hypothetical protein [Halanaeroarchaeum sp. HSR-CO]UWG49172.1 hypothetical protein HSRCO_3031 [Halanaeroarchaeum sp. HSR-CO]
MSDAWEAVEGVVALVTAGFILIVMGSSLEPTVSNNLNAFGVLMILLGIVLAVALVATIIGTLASRVS